MHDMAQPFLCGRSTIADRARLLFGSDPHECFVDNFLTWAEPVRFHPKPKPVRKPAAKKPARRKLPTRKPAASVLETHLERQCSEIKRGVL